MQQKFVKIRAILNIVLSGVLLFNLLFIQVVSGFLHNHTQHSAHQKKHDNPEQEICKADEKCKICSLNLSHELYYNDLVFVKSPVFYTYNNYSLLLLKAEKITPESSGRSPPAANTI